MSISHKSMPQKILKMPEIAAPAGGEEALRAAVENGADAVYLGGKKFGARHYAENFTNEQLEEAVEYAHSKNAKIYVTVNTLIKESEIGELVSYLEFLSSVKADAVIVQDLGALHLIKERFPELRVHASTQMNIHNASGVNFLEEWGVKRAVLARELSLEEIRKISEKTKMELEIFVHGALCFSYSGNCLFSSMLGGRSANRGRCAQACRRRYALIKKIDKNREEARLKNAKYLLSMKDLCCAEILPEIVSSGVKALKIEGRMKRAEYVAVVVGIYRKLLDRIQEGNFYITEDERKELLQIFNREFTHSYLTGERRGMVNPVACDNAGIEIGKVVGKNGNRIRIKLFEDLSSGDGVEIALRTRTIGKCINFSAGSGAVIEIELKNAGEVLLGSAVHRTCDIKLIKKAQKSYAKP